MSKKCRIVERTLVSGKKQYVIQQKHFLLIWMWVDAWINSISGPNCIDYFDTMEEAQAHLKYFDGTKHTDCPI